MGKRELVALLGLSSWCLVMVVWLFLAMPWVCLGFVVVVFSDHTLLLFLHALLNKQRELLTIAKATAGLCHRLNLTQLHKMNIA